MRKPGLGYLDMLINGAEVGRAVTLVVDVDPFLKPFPFEFV
jgi:hypothetical protein